MVHNLHNRMCGLLPNNMSTRFLHTADWQLGKPFAGVEEEDKRVLVQQERINVLQRIGQAARDQRAEFILIAGDLFDSPTPKKATVSAACSAIGGMRVPVYAIPGNHDHAGPGSLWEQEFFRHEWRQLAPNLHLLLKAEPVVLEQAVIFPCPLLRRHEAIDPTTWLRSPTLDLTRFGDKPRVVLAHGSVQGFAALESDEEDAGGGLPNQIDLDRLPGETFDYIALGGLARGQKGRAQRMVCGHPRAGPVSQGWGPHSRQGAGSECAARRTSRSGAIRNRTSWVA